MFLYTSHILREKDAVFCFLDFFFMNLGYMWEKNCFTILYVQNQFKYLQFFWGFPDLESVIDMVKAAKII